MTEYNSQFKLRNLEPEVKAVDIDKYLWQFGGLLNGLGGFIKDSAECYKINELFITALMILESGWGKSKIAREKNNLCGWGAVDSDPYEGAWYFHTKQGCIMTVCRFLDRDYLTKTGKYYYDGTIGGVNKHYSSDPKWADKICQIMNQIRKGIGSLEKTTSDMA